MPCEEIHTFTITPTVDGGNAYANNDLIFDTTEITTKLKTFGRTGYIAAVTVNDKSDQGAILNIVFLKENRDAGSINSAPTLSDAHADDILGVVAIAAADWYDAGGSKQANKNGVNIPFGNEGSGLYCFCSTGASTPTYAASALVVRVTCHVY